MHEPVNINSILPMVKKPGRYIGKELHASTTLWEQTTLRFNLVFPDLYEIGMSHQGLQILYHILNDLNEVLAERCYAPDVDMEKQLRTHGLPIFSIESRRPLFDFDVLGFTLPYELCYTNILTILDLASIPFRSANRSDFHPLILGGGSCSMNPEPIADFFDAIVLGDGEETIVEIATVLLEAKRNSVMREVMLDRLSEIKGVYVPAFFKPVYNGKRLVYIKPLRTDYSKVKRRVLATISDISHLTKPLVPLVKPIHDRLGVEIARGCTRGCRFCQAGITYRPVRERDITDIMYLACEGIRNSGFDELALLSLSSGDYSCLTDLIHCLMDSFAKNYTSVSMPSMRVGTLTPEIMNQIKRVRKTGFTVAPEAGTDRLRQVINKGILEEDLLETCSNAFEMGWELIKLYFMIGLPTEQLEDVEAIVNLAKKARYQAKSMGGRSVQINVSVSTFVPKPHTPFQWESQVSLSEARERINLLKRQLPKKGFKLKWHDPDQSFMEGVFSRGDRQLSLLIEQAYFSGVRLDGWSEHFCLEKWQKAAHECEIELEQYLNKREKDEVLPWDHLDSGISRDFLEAEYFRSREQVYTPDCRVHGCQKCGLCDFKDILPVRAKKKEKIRPCLGLNDDMIASNDESSVRYKYRVCYSKLDDARFLGHLELLQLIHRAVRRARLPVLYSRGYNPCPRISFSSALPVGVESEAEFFDMELSMELVSIGQVIKKLSAVLPDFIAIKSIESVQKTTPAITMKSYQILFKNPLGPDKLDNLKDFLASESYPIEKIRKGKKKELDIRPLVAQANYSQNILLLDLIHNSDAAGVSPKDFLVFGLKLGEDEACLARIKKTREEELG